MASSAIATMSNYAKRMARLSARIFNEVARPTNQKSMKVVRLYAAKPLDKCPEIVEYYPHHYEITTLMHELRKLGLYRDEHLDFVDEMKRLRALRGKGKPPKGQGRRAQKKK
jgi:small subunit ribosomal protein S33